MTDEPVITEPEAVPPVVEAEVAAEAAPVEAPAVAEAPAAEPAPATAAPEPTIYQVTVTLAADGSIAQAAVTEGGETQILVPARKPGTTVPVSLTVAGETITGTGTTG